ncbi:MAG TPA: glycosyltransferase, partial [Acidimicrobiia bacterium]|nr:glycosyltransferase [Acidimicrobiia bacterium]
RNTGHQSGPNNEGLRVARGAIVANLGHDDLWLPRHLERAVGAVDAGATLAFGRVLTVEGRGIVRVWPREGWQYRPGRWITPSAMAYRRDVAVEVGGWRGLLADGDVPDDGPGTWTPEGDFCQRVTAGRAEPRALPYLTCVKFPAFRRRNVYRDRPHHEQEEWLRRIRAAADPETELARFETDFDAAPLATRAMRSLRYRGGRVWHRVDPRTRAQRVRHTRRHKGLDR